MEQDLLIVSYIMSHHQHQDYETSRCEQVRKLRIVMHLHIWDIRQRQSINVAAFSMHRMKRLACSMASENKGHPLVPFIRL